MKLICAAQKGTGGNINRDAVKETGEFIGIVLSIQLQLSFMSFILLQPVKKHYLPLTLCLALEGFGVVGLLGFGVVGLLVFGVVGLLDRDPVRKSGNRCGETERLSTVRVKQL